MANELNMDFLKMKYTCVSKPGTYEFIGNAAGQGPVKGYTVSVYRCIETGELLWRMPSDFGQRMVPIVSAKTH